MRPLHLLAVSVLLLAGMPVMAASNQPSFTTTGLSCADVTWKAEVLAKYPGIGAACQGVEERNGVPYVKFVGTVKHASASRLRLHFKGTEKAVLLNTSTVDKLYMGNQTTSARDIMPGTELTFYVPADRFVASFFGDEVLEITLVEIIEFEIVEEAPIRTASAEELPRTATQWPLAALLGGLLILVAGGLAFARHHRS